MAHPSTLAALCGGFAVALSTAACGADPYPGQTDERTLHIALISEMNGFDPAQASEEIRTTCVLNTYDSLYAYAYLKRPYELEPCLAASMPDVSADGLVWRIPLKRGSSAWPRSSGHCRV